MPSSSRVSEIYRLTKQRDQALEYAKRCDQAISALKAVGAVSLFRAIEVEDSSETCEEKPVRMKLDLKMKQISSSGLSKRRPRHPDGSALERIVKFFVLSGNKWASNAMIREALGIDRGAIAVELYKKDLSIFESTTEEIEGKKAWRLTETALKKYAEHI